MNKIYYKLVAEMRQKGNRAMNVNKLKGKIVENGLNVSQLASSIGIDRTTLYRKLTSNGDTLTISEAEKISKVLNLSMEEVNAIFFTDFVAQYANLKREVIL